MPANSLLLAQLGELRHRRIKVFVTSGTAYTGKLKDFDNDVMVVSGLRPQDPDNTVLLEHVSAFREAKGGE